MQSLQPPEQRLFQALAQADPALETMAAENRGEEGQFLEYVYLGDVARHVAALAQDARSPSPALDLILTALEGALDGDEQVTNLIAVGFLESLKAIDALETVRGRFGPKLIFGPVPSESEARDLSLCRSGCRAPKIPLIPTKVGTQAVRAV